MLGSVDVSFAAALAAVLGPESPLKRSGDQEKTLAVAAFTMRLIA